MKSVVRHFRVDKGTWNELIESAWIHYKEHGRESITNAFTEAVADRIIGRYQEKLVNGFARAGIEIDPNVALTAQGLAAIVSEQSGIEIDTMTPQSVTAAIDRVLSQRMTALLQVQIDSVLNPYEFRAALEEAAIRAIQDGRATQFISKQAMRAARKYATMQRRGLDTPDEQRRVKNREYQRRYRQTHKLVWD